MSDLGDISYFLGIEFYKSNKGLMMHQRRYASEILKRFEIEEHNSISTHVEPRLYSSKDQIQIMSTQPNIEDLLDHKGTFVTKGLT